MLECFISLCEKLQTSVFLGSCCFVMLIIRLNCVVWLYLLGCECRLR